MTDVQQAAIDLTLLSPAKRALFEQRLKGLRTAPTTRISPRPVGEPAPLSFAQERVWFMEQLAPGTAAYLSPQLLSFGPTLDIDALRTAMAQVIARHESLRMRFPSDADGRPTVVVQDELPDPIVLRDVPDAETATQRIQQVAETGFDLATGPLLRAELLRVDGGRDHLLVVGMHHIITDGWSNDVMLKELGARYHAAAVSDQDSDPGSGLEVAADIAEEPVQYGDFARYQRTLFAAPEMVPRVAHWVERLTGVPVLTLPTDAPRPAEQTFVGRAHPFRLPPETVTALQDWGRRHRATPFMTLLTAYQLLLSTFAGQVDFAVGSPVAGRSLPELDAVMGMFVNMLPIRADLSGNPTVDETLQRTRSVVLDALAHEDVPFEQVIQQLNLPRDPSRPPLFQAMFVLQNYARFDKQPGTTANTAAAAGNAEIGWRPVDLPATRFEIELHAHATPDGSLACRMIANPDLLHAEFVRQLVGSFTELAARLPTAGDTRISDLSLLDADQRADLQRWNDTAVAYPRVGAGTLTELIETQVARTPGARVTLDGGTSVSFAELDAAANAIGHRLQAGGVGAESIVAVCAERSIDLVVGLLGVLKAGAAYLPLDPEYPTDRIAFMLSDSGAAALLATREMLAGPLADTLASADHAPPVFVLDDPAQWADQPTTAPPRDITASSAAYLIYTSGSTGRPKGVVNEHRGIVNRLRWMQDRFDIGGSDTVLQKTPASFDVSVWEFFWPLTTGANLVLAEPGGHRDPGYLRRVIGDHSVTTAHFVPSMLQIFLTDLSPHDGAGLPLRSIVCSGEELRADTALACLDAIPQAELHNLYGPTEAAIDVTAWRCERDSITRTGRVSIGSPVANTTVHILDAGGHQVPIGALGQLHIGGLQVARGYHGRPELTAERFVADPFTAGSDDTGGDSADRNSAERAATMRMYATGDLARWRPDGTIEFHGRQDGQVKLRGQRIELGEIEHALLAVPGVLQAAAAIKEPTPTDFRLVGYVVGQDAPDAEKLRAALGTSQPAYMVPAHFVTVQTLPLTPNGKLDRAALPMPEASTSTADYIEPEPGVQAAIAAVWQQVLGTDRVGAHDDFFALGGHSLLATQVVAKLRSVTENTGAQIGVMDIFQHPTVAGLAALVDAGADRQRGLLYELTAGKNATTKVRSYVCVPYGGGSAAVYQPLADALPDGHALYSVAIPGHDVGLDEHSLPFDELATRCATEIIDTVTGPLVLYGHCGVGGALIVEVGRKLEAAGREVEAIYAGGIFPFARASGTLARVSHWFASRASNRSHSNWLKSMGVDLDDLEPGQADRIITNMRNDGDHAEEHFTALLATDPPRLRAPIISVVGERDPVTDYYLERYKEWEFLTDTTAVVVLAEAGHFFLKYRADDLVEVITCTHDAVQRGRTDELPRRTESANWWLEDTHRRDTHRRNEAGAPEIAAATAVPDSARAPIEPSMRRFLLIASGQLTSTIGSQLTGWALPIWILQRTGSLGLFGLTSIIAFLPIIVASPLAGAWADRFDRRKVIMTAGATSAIAEAAVAGFVLRDSSSLVVLFAMVLVLSAAGTVQRIAFTAAIPQIVPKRFIGHANGVVQIINGAGQLFIPLAAVGLFALIGLRGVLFIDLLSYVFALSVLAVVRFPNRMGRVRKESFGDQIFGGVRLTWGNRHFRAMLIFFGVGNLLYAPALLLTTPLVLGFGTLTNVGQAAAAEAVGALLGGLVMGVWGGPMRFRMRVNMMLIAGSAICVIAAGLHPSMGLVVVALCGTNFCLGLANGIYMTIIQTKIPQRFHGRVFAVNQTIAWSTFPIGFAVAPWIAAHWFQPWLEPGGALAGSVGQIVGTGPGRGVGLAFVIFGIGMLANSLFGLFLPVLRNLDVDVPDAEPDDLIGVAELKRLHESTAGPAHRRTDPAGTATASGRAG